MIQSDGMSRVCNACSCGRTCNDDNAGDERRREIAGSLRGCRAKVEDSKTTGTD